MNIEERVKKWEEIKAKIDIFSLKNPEGSMKEFFETQPKGTRSSYYSFKPKDYCWPNPRTNGSKAKRDLSNLNRSDKPHNRFFKRNSALRYAEIYDLQIKMGLNPDEPPDDWHVKKYDYLKKLKALLNPIREEPEEEEEEEEEIPMFELPDYRSETKPIKQEEQPKYLNNNFDNDANRDKLQAIIRVYEQTIQAIKELS